MNDRITGPLSILILACCAACGLDTLGTDCTWSRVARQSSAPKRYEQTLTRSHAGDVLMFGGVDSFEGPLLGDLQRFSSGRWTDTARHGLGPPTRPRRGLPRRAQSPADLRRRGRRHHDGSA